MLLISLEDPVWNDALAIVVMIRVQVTATDFKSEFGIR